MTSLVKNAVQEDMKAAMRAHDKERLGTIRLILSSCKQREVDERIILTDADLFSILDKMLKQRRESVAQYQAGNRPDLVATEEAEMAIIQSYLPTPLSSAQIDSLIAAAIQESGAASLRDMGKVMAILKPKIQGRADIAAVSAYIKEKLAAT